MHCYIDTQSVSKATYVVFWSGLKSCFGSALFNLTNYTMFHIPPKTRRKTTSRLLIIGCRIINARQIHRYTDFSANFKLYSLYG